MERSTPSQRLALVDLPYSRTDRAAWPVLVARAGRAGANAVVLTSQSASTAIPGPEVEQLHWLVQLCGRAGLGVVMEYPDAAEPLPVEDAYGRHLTEIGKLDCLYLAGGLGRFRTDGSATARVWTDRLLLMLLSAALPLTVAAHPMIERSADKPVAWADASDVTIAVRHGEQQSIILVDNRRADSYTGMLTYRDRNDELLHLQVNIGPFRSGCVLLDGEEIGGVIVTGDASEGTWVVRAMQTSVVFSGGAGGLVPCGDGAVLLASQSGRFQLRRPQGWGDLCAMRLTQHGALLDAPIQPDSVHLTVPYIAEDMTGQTDLYVLAPTAGLLPEPFCRYLGALCAARAATMQVVAELVGDSHYGAAAEGLTEMASAAHNGFTAQEYRNAWDAADQATAVFLSTHHASDRAHSSELRAGLSALEEWGATH